MSDMDDGLTPSQKSWLSVAPNPTWLEINRSELLARQQRLSSLIGRLRSKANVSPSILSDEEFQLLEDVWQMHVELLK